MLVHFSAVHYYTVWCYVFVLDEYSKARVSSLKKEMLWTLHDVSDYQLAVFNSMTIHAITLILGLYFDVSLCDFCDEQYSLA